MLRKSWHHNTESRHVRGYGTAWDKLRLVVLKRDLYLCQCPECKSAGRITPANEVDHIIPRADFEAGRATGDSEALTNLRAVNEKCHDRLDLEQRGFRARPEIGIDGWPIQGTANASSRASTAGPGRASAHGGRPQAPGGIDDSFSRPHQDRRAASHLSVPHDSP